MMVVAGGDKKEAGDGGASLLTHMLSLIGWSIKPGDGEKDFRLITNLNEDSRIVVNDTFIKAAVRSIFGEKKGRDGGANSCLICLPLNHSQIYYDEESQAVVIDAGEAFMSLHRL